MTVKELIEKLTKAGNRPCFEATEFALRFKTPQEAWESCDRGDWFLWIYARLPGMDRTLLVKCACKCARRSLKYITDKNEKRPLQAIEAAERWAKEPNETTARAAEAAEAAGAAAEAAGAAWAEPERKAQAKLIRKIIPSIKNLLKGFES